jgi:hypothetical protein
LAYFREPHTTASGLLKRLGQKVARFGTKVLTVAGDRGALIFYPRLAFKLNPGAAAMRQTNPSPSNTAKSRQIAAINLI